MSESFDSSQVAASIVELVPNVGACEARFCKHRGSDGGVTKPEQPMTDFVCCNYSCEPQIPVLGAPVWSKVLTVPEKSHVPRRRTDMVVCWDHTQ